MNKIFNGVLVATLICSASVFTSCSDDDSKTEKKQFRLVECNYIYDDESGAYYTTHYVYDNQGRVISDYGEGVDEEGNFYHDGWSYTYGDHQIIAKGQLRESTVIYTLNDDGLIIKEEHVQSDYPEDSPRNLIEVFEYDSQGRMIHTVEEDVKFFWDGDDLMSFEAGDQNERTSRGDFTYTELTVDHGYTEPFLKSFDETLFMMGYYGKTPKHLIAQSKRQAKEISSDLEFTYNFTYTLSDGHIDTIEKESVTSIRIGNFNSERREKRTVSYVWESF